MFPCQIVYFEVALAFVSILDKSHVIGVIFLAKILNNLGLIQVFGDLGGRQALPDADEPISPCKLAFDTKVVILLNFERFATAISQNSLEKA